MKKTLAILPGDGIGPEVMDEATKVLSAVAEKFGHEFEYRLGLIGGAAWPEHQNHFPEETLQLCKQADAILFGSVGGPIDQMDQPQWKDCEKNSILGIRKAFGFNANFRPAKIYPQLTRICPLKEERIQDGVDILIIRELIGGIYFGEHKTETIDGKRVATDTMSYDEDQIAAVAHVAFQAAQKRGKKLTSVDKSNVLDCSRLWKEVVTEVSAEYPDVELNHILVDNCAMQLIKRPGDFDVLLAPNMFGDILSDEASVLPGSLGLMASASMNAEGFGMYEPAGGSAPKLTGQNRANPIAQILSAAMMLRFSFDMQEEADAIEQAIEKVIESGQGTYDIAASDDKVLGTRELGTLIAKHISDS